MGLGRIFDDEETAFAREAAESFHIRRLTVQVNNDDSLRRGGKQRLQAGRINVPGRRLGIGQNRPRAAVGHCVGR